MDESEVPEPDMAPLDVEPFDMVPDFMWDFFMLWWRIEWLFIFEPLMPLVDDIEPEPIEPDDIEPVEPVVCAMAPVANASVAAQTSAVLIIYTLLFADHRLSVCAGRTPEYSACVLTRRKNVPAEALVPIAC